MIEYIITAFEVLRNNKMRSILTTLGIIIGVSSVVAIVSLGEGMAKTVEKQYDPSMAMINYDWSKLKGVQDYVSHAEVEILNEAFINKVEGMAHKIKDGRILISNDKNNSTQVNLEYATPSTLLVEGEKIKYGRDFIAQDRDLNKRVVIISVSTALELFEREDVVGEKISFKDNSFSIIGILEDKHNPLGFFDESENLPIMYATDTLAFEEIGLYYGTDSSVKVKLKEGENIDVVMGEIVDLLKQIKGSEAYTYSTVTTDIDTANETLRLITVTVSAIAGISLLVGCIGVVNIMLVSVTERTREIGIRKAIGAKDSHILKQFIIEAVIVSLIGGIIGVIIGISASFLILYKLEMVSVISLQAIVISTIGSIIVGIISGIYPARKASKLDPVVSLGYEV